MTSTPASAPRPSAPSPRASAPGHPADSGSPPVDDFASLVLDVVDSIPPGRVMAYGDIAEYLAAGPGPRQVGRVLAVYGGAVPWWRVTHSDGTPAPGHDSRALEHYLAEGTPLRSARPPVRVDMPRARWPGLRLSKKIVEIMAYLELLGNYSYPNLPRKPYHPRKSR